MIPTMISKSTTHQSTRTNPPMQNNPVIATTTESTLPHEYAKHEKVFSEEKSQRLPKHTIWDHVIELLPRAPTTMPGQLLPLNQKEIEEVHKFIQKHLAQGTI